VQRASNNDPPMTEKRNISIPSFQNTNDTIRNPRLSVISHVLKCNMNNQKIIIYLETDNIAMLVVSVELNL
jgi:hypothetical protein